MKKRKSKLKPLLIALICCVVIGILGSALDNGSPDPSPTGEPTGSVTPYVPPTGDAATDTPAQSGGERIETSLPADPEDTGFRVQDIPPFTDKAYAVVHDNIPYFTASDLTAESYEFYSPLDSAGRCGPAMACVGQDIMPTEPRGSIGSVKPTGWQTVKYDCVDGKYLYNRCHLIGYQLSGENANERNLITGTRYMNVDGMLPFENMVADYVKETGNHVLYRVTPVFEGDNLVATGVLMEAWSVEDDGEGICYNVFCYNSQPTIVINYADGSSSQEEKPAESKPVEQTQKPVVVQTTYILNKNTKKFHYASCSSVKQMKEENKLASNASRDSIIAQGYSPCGNCHP